MEFDITEEKVIEVANRYGIEARKTNSPEEAGFIIGGKQLNAEDLFDLLFQGHSLHNYKKLKDEYEHWKKVVKNYDKDYTDFPYHEEVYTIAFANGFVAAVNKCLGEVSNND